MSVVPPFPLQWPEMMPRYRGTRQAGAFKTSLTLAMKNVNDSLRRFAVDSGKPLANVVISSNVTLGVTNPADPGVSVWFIWDGMSVCIPVDRYAKVEANLQAIHHIIEARRTELRHGTLALVRATFQGFTALPSPASKKTWREVLGVAGSGGSREVIEAQFRSLAKVRHPDVAGGSHEAMAELNRAKDEALREIGGAS